MMNITRLVKAGAGGCASSGGGGHCGGGGGAESNMISETVQKHFKNGLEKSWRVLHGT